MNNDEFGTTGNELPSIPSDIARVTISSMSLRRFAKLFCESVNVTLESLFDSVLSVKNDDPLTSILPALFQIDNKED